MKMILGSRGSKLALAQSGMIADRLRADGHEVEIREISTRGDQQRELAFQRIGAPGVFVRELERALLAGEVDEVVHSYKDLPSASPEGLVVAAIPGRRDAADRLLIRPQAYRRGDEAEPLPLIEGARVGTASARRAALLLDLRPDVEVVHLRGNVPTRLAKLRGGDYDAILLAAAGLDRLGSSTVDVVDHRLDPTIFIPAPSQGALAVQVRIPHGGRRGARDRQIHDLVQSLDEAAARLLVRAERRLQALIEGGCQTAFGAWCRFVEHGGAGEGWMRMDAALGTGSGLRRATGEGRDPLGLAEELWRQLRGAESAKERRAGAEDA